MLSRGDRIRTVVVLASALTVLCGCVRPGEPVAQQLDLAILDVGSHSIDPMTPPATSTEKYGRVLESVRMGEAALDPVEVDPTLTNGISNRTAPLPTPFKAAGILAEPVRKVLESQDMLAGFAVSGSDVNFRGKAPEIGAARLLTVLLLRFPDDTKARLAARQMNATDAAVTADNVSVRIAEYPGAFAHWRPTVPTMAATIAHGSFVVSVLAAHTSPDQTVLTGMVRKAFDVQLPRLQGFQPTPPDRFAELPLDRDGMVARLLPAGAGHWLPPTVLTFDTEANAGWSSSIAITGVVFGPRATRLMKHFGFKDPIEVVAVHGNNVVERFPDAVSARRIFTIERQSSNAATMIDTPAGVPDVYCNDLEQPPASTEQVYCHVLAGRYTASIAGRSPAHAMQQAAAQYALLVRSE